MGKIAFRCLCALFAILFTSCSKEGPLYKMEHIRKVGNDHSKQALASCSTPLRKTKSPPENEGTRRAGDIPLPAKDFGTASLPPTLVHSARWYLMRLYDTNAQLSGWTVKEVYKSQVFDVKNKTIRYLCTWTKATDMVIARRVKDKLSSTPAGVVLTTRDFGQESFPTLHTKRYPLSSISSIVRDNWSRIWRDEMYRKVVEMYCY